MSNILSVILHFDEYLKLIVTQYGTLTYIFLFIIIFAETGLVFFPFLPGDSLLFAAGAIAALGDRAGGKYRFYAGMAVNFNRIIFYQQYGGIFD